MTIYYNYLSVTAMGNLIAGLPTRSGDAGNVFAIVDPDPDTGSSNEGNAITAAQASQAIAKNWIFYHYNWSNDAWESIADIASLRGDVDGDGEVSISDVSKLTDYLLTGNASGVNLSGADADQDGEVAIADVSAIIDYLLAGNW